MLGHAEAVLLAPQVAPLAQGYEVHSATPGVPILVRFWRLAFQAFFFRVIADHLKGMPATVRRTGVGASSKKESPNGAENACASRQ